MGGAMTVDDLPIRRVRLEVEELAFTRPSGDLFGPMSFSVHTDEILGVIGPTGAGKGDLVDLLCGRQMARAGAIKLDGQRIDMLPAHARSRLGLVMVAGSAPALPDVTVHDWLAMSIQLVDRSPLQLLLRGRRRLDSRQIGDIEATLQFCSLHHVAGDSLASLTPAQRRMTEIARGLCQRPRLLLLHRPLAGLPRMHRHDFSLVLRDIAAEAVSMVVIDEQLDALATLCQRFIVLQRGHLVASGSLDVLGSNQAAMQAFTGTAPGKVA
ncbi:MAG: ATP-binding cassette domain-containing protein [Geminicoccaceae bacterium]|nr:ATP-binding cassette domain-containing protein [Geminicoccaceae bacterium]MCB9943542.1 ATP-binding cassette domain-containing protein [Geminicoccaceae bacterium]